MAKCIAAKMCLRHYQTDSRITNHVQRAKLSTVTNSPFIQNSNQRASRLTATTSFPRVFFQLLQFSSLRPSLSAHKATLMTESDLTFSAFSLRTFAPIVSAILTAQIHMPRHGSSARAKYQNEQR